MTSDWTRVRALFEAALDLDEEERTAFLAENCGDDEELRRQVDELLAADSSEFTSGVAIEKPLPADVVEAELSEAVAGQKIGAYEIQRVLGSGGMSTVFLAVQENPKREVALKTMRVGMFSADARRRFEYESEILGRLRHPAIAQVYEAGTWQEPLAGQEVPFFALEYVRDAVPLDRYVRDTRLDLRDALDLFTEVCDAVHYGHQLGVIHRDLKPANVLVDGEGRPKVIDFGIARATESDVQGLSMHTQTGHVLGTLRYMAPEQLDGGDVDTRIDVYALGVILYELLAGIPLLDPGTLSLTAFARRVREMEPPRPSRSDKGFVLSGDARDLDWITRKAIAIDRDERYRAVSELAADIRRFAANEPVSVGPPSTAYYLRKFIRRNKVLVGGVSVAFLVLVAGIITTTWQMFRAERAAETARREATKAQTINAFFNDLLKFADPFEGRYRSRPDWTVREALDAAADFFPRLVTEPEVEAQVRLSIGNAYKSLGQLDKAEEYLQRAIELRREHLGPEHPDLADAMLSMGATKSAKDEEEAALGFFRPAAEIFRKNFGERHPDLGLCTLNIGVALVDLGRVDEGEPYIERAAEMFRSLSPTPYRFIALCLPHLGNIAYNRKEFDKATAYYREAIEMFAKADKAWHPHAAIAHASLAGLLRDHERDMAGAQKHYGLALEINENAWGRNSVQVRKSLVPLAMLMGKQGRPAEEAKYRRRILEVDKVLAGAGTKQYAASCIRLATALQGTGGHNLDEATSLLREAVRIYEAIGEPVYYTIGVQTRLASNLRASKKLDDAMRVAQQAYESGVAAGGEREPRLRLIALEYSKCLRQAGRLAKAERIMRLRIEIETAARNHIHLLLVRTELAHLLTLAEKFDEAREVFASVAKSPPPGLDKDSWLFAQHYRAHGMFLWKVGEYERGVERLETAAAIFKRQLGERHPNVALTLRNLAELYEAWNKPEEAKKTRARIPGGN